MVADKTTGVGSESHYTTIQPKEHAHVMLTQMNVREGLFNFSEIGNEAILKELNQLHDKRALMPVRRQNCHTKNEKGTKVPHFPKTKSV